MIMCAPQLWFQRYFHQQIGLRQFAGHVHDAQAFDIHHSR